MGTGERLSFQNTLLYNDKNAMNENATLNITYFKDFVNTESECEVFVDGHKCDFCAGIRCRSDFIGFQIMCENVMDVEGFGGKGFNFNSCSECIDPGFLRVFNLYDKGQ